MLQSCYTNYVELESTEAIEGYFQLADELDTVQRKFCAQDWVQALLAKRLEDNKAGVAVQDREPFPVTRQQLLLTNMFFHERADSKLFGYRLKVVQE